MTQEPSTLYAKLLGETAEISLKELEPFFAKGALLWVDPDLDLIAAAEAVDMRHMGIDMLDHRGARLLDFDCELRIGEPADFRRGGIVPAHVPVKRVLPPAQSLVGELRLHDVVE